MINSQHFQVPLKTKYYKNTRIAQENQPVLHPKKLVIITYKYILKILKDGRHFASILG